MRSVVGRIFLMAAAAANTTMAQAAPLTPGHPAGIRAAQASSSFWVFSGVATVAAGAGYLFSSSLGGSTDSTIIAINGGQSTPNAPSNTTTATTGTP